MKYKLKIEFNWHTGENNKLEPILYTELFYNYIEYVKEKKVHFFHEYIDTSDIEYKGLITALLTEYAWESYEERKLKMKKEVEKAIDEIEMVFMEKKTECHFLSIESWGAEIRKEGALIYFLFTEDYFDIIPANCFYEILVNWRKFLDTTPDLNRKISFECEGD